MNKVKYIIGVVISACLMASCTQEDVLSTGEEYNDNQARYITLNFNTPSILNATVSRAANEEREDYLVNDLYIYVFDADNGELLTMNGEKKNCPAYLEGEALTNGTAGEQLNEENIYLGKYSSCWVRFKVDSKAFNKDVYIYLIANTKGYENILELDPSLYPSSGQITQKDQLDQLVYIYKKGSDHSNRKYILMSGNADASQGWNSKSVNAVRFHITETGNIVRADDLEALITLQRAEAKINFTFNSGTKGTFIPEKYQIHNLPLKSNMLCQYYLQSNFTNHTDMIGRDASQESKDFISTNEITINNPAAFTFYMAENLKVPNEANGGKIIDKILAETTNSKGYSLREATDADGNWKNAPTLATYVEITGTYTEKATVNGKEENVETQVTYFIHLGFSSKSGKKSYYVNDYIVRRNYAYTYNITVNGIDNIGTKVVQE